MKEDHTLGQLLKAYVSQIIIQQQFDDNGDQWTFAGSISQSNENNISVLHVLR
jgi:hypothetical protein